MDSIQQRFKQLRTCVLVPTYNNAKTLGKLLEELKQYTDQIIVVNDGSTDGTSEILKASGLSHIISYDKNVGKGWALRCGFKKALELGFQYAITIDSDGQHFPEDLPKFLDELENYLPKEGAVAVPPSGPPAGRAGVRGPSMGCLIIGKRNMGQAGIPGKSSFGNKFSNFWYWVETGIKMEDTQSGYRLYPIERLKATTFFTRKFEFEIEVIVRAAWSGIPVTSVPVKIFYEEKSKRVSHFRPFKDFSRISVLNTILVTIALLYIKPRDFFRGLLKKESRQKIMFQLFHPDDSPSKKAISMGFGVFMGIVPIWGFQLVTAIALSVFLRLNKALVIVAANISIPPMIPFIIYLSNATGKIWMGEQAVSLTFDKNLTLEDIQNSFVQYVLGAVTLALLAGLITTALSFVLLTLFKKSGTKT